jgi:hypothetical protein
MTKSIEEITIIAVKIQNASNIVAVTGEFREAMIACREAGIEPRKSPAVLAIFYKVFDMMGAPSNAEMYDAFKTCEASL